MSNSSLVEYTKISPYKTSPRNHSIDTITIHCVASNASLERLGEIFSNTNPPRNASCNYGVDYDGRIGMYCEEKDRSWCSSNRENDHRAITIEVASDNKHPYAVTDGAYEGLIRLCADICLRNGIEKLMWQGDDKLIGQVDKQNMTVHRWFAAKACPGDYLYERHGEIAMLVNELIASESIEQHRIAGANRYATAVEVSKGLYPNGADHVIICSGDSSSDQASASTLASGIDFPLLYVASDHVPGDTADELKRLGASSYEIVGGTTAVSLAVEKEIQDILGV